MYVAISKFHFTPNIDIAKTTKQTYCIFLHGNCNTLTFDETNEIKDYAMPSEKDLKAWRKAKNKNHFKWKIDGYNIIRDLQENGVKSDWYFGNLGIYKSTFSK